MKKDNGKSLHYIFMNMDEKKKVHTDQEVLEAVKMCTLYCKPCASCPLKPLYCGQEKRNLTLKLAAVVGL